MVSSETWVYTPLTDTFVKKSSSPFAGLQQPGMVFDKHIGLVLVHASASADWTYNVGTDSWTQITTNNTGPAQSCGSCDGMGIDSVNNRLVYWRGSQSTGGDIWVGQLSTPTMRSGSGTPAAGTGNDGDLYHRTDVASIYGPKLGGVWSSTFSYIVGKGCSTGYHIDKDCDGYGLGPTVWSSTVNMTVDPNPLFGRDGDDNDPNVYDFTTAISSWGSVNNFLTHLGYPTNRVFYIDPVNGSDSNSGTLASPYQHWDAIGATIHDGAGGTVLYSQATLAGGIGICGFGGPCYNPTATSSATPIVIMPLPGQTVTIHGSGCLFANDSTGNQTSNNVVWDGWTCKADNYGAGTGFNGDHTTNFTIKNTETTGFVIGWEMGSGSWHTFMDNNLYHDIREHAIYPTSAGLYTTSQYNCAQAEANYDFGLNASNPFIDFEVTNNLFYNLGQAGFEPVHLNAVICGALVTGNVVWNGGGTGMGLQTGVQNALVANNVIYSNQSAAMTVSVYGCDNNNDPAGCTAAQLAGVCLGSGFSEGVRYYPDEIKNVKIVNNTFWTGFHGPSGGGNCIPDVTCNAPTRGIDVIAYDCGTPDSRTIKNLTIQNNLIESYNDCGGGTQELFFSQRSYPDTNVIKNNMLYNMAPGNSQCAVMYIDTTAVTNFSTGPYTFSQFQGYNTSNNGGNLFADPMLVNISTGYYLTPNLFNLHVQSNSPVISSGTPLGSPTYDASGLLRPYPPSIGAYEFSASTSVIGAAKTMTYLSGNGQSVAISTPLALPFYAVIKDSNSLNVQGTTVTWTVTGGPGYLTEVSSVSDVNGIVSALLTTGGAGTYTVTVSSTGLINNPITFTALQGTAGPASSMTYVSGNGQSAAVSTILGSAFIAEVTDSSGNAVSGTTVTWAVTGGGGVFASSQPVSDVNGLVQAVLTLGSSPGTNTVTCSSSTLAGSPVTFTATATGGSFPGTTGDPLASKYAPVIDPQILVTTSRLLEPSRLQMLFIKSFKVPSPQEPTAGSLCTRSQMKFRVSRSMSRLR